MSYKIVSICINVQFKPECFSVYTVLKCRDILITGSGHQVFKFADVT